MKLIDTQMRLLAAASQRDDRLLERPSNLPDSTAAVAKLLTEGWSKKSNPAVSV